MGNNGSQSEEKNRLNSDSMISEQYTGDIKDNKRNGRGTYIYGNGDRYEGNWSNDLRHGKGTFYYKTGELYIGEWKNNQKDGFGKYFYQNGERYLGTWQNNMKEGEGTLYLVDGSYFKGNFFENKKHGKGEMHMANGETYLEEWENGSLKCQIEQVLMDEASNLKQIEKKNSKDKDSMSLSVKSDKKTSKEESKSNEISPNLKSKDFLDINEENKVEIKPIKEVSKEFEENLTSEQNKHNNEEGNMMNTINNQLYETENNLDLEANMNKYESKFESKFESTAEKDLFSEVKSELKTIDPGFDTLTLIEQIEMFNSLNSSFLNKNIQDWTPEDVGEWLTIIGLTEYVDNFTKNHINGKILFDITDKELKEDLEVISIGHRKNFKKAVQHLKKFYAKNRLYSDSIKNKLIKFYEKHRNQLKIGKKDFNFFEPKNDTIQEAQDEMSYKESPAVMTVKHENGNVEDAEQEFNLDVYEEDAVLHLNEKLNKTKSKNKKNHFVIENNNKKYEEDDVPTSKKLSPVIPKETEINSINKKSESINDEENAKIHSKNEISIKSEELSHKNSNSDNINNINIPNNAMNSLKIETNLSVIKEEQTEGTQENLILDSVVPKLKQVNEDSSSSSSSSSSSDDEKKTNKITKPPHTEENEKTESPPTKKHGKRSYPKKEEHKRRKKIEGEDALTYDQKFIMKTFREAGIGSNFLIAYKELEMLKKIGEGGYGDVYLGKWLGQEVAIKQYGKNSSRLRNTKKITDFIKEVEVISNLRHPNIVLYMGVCINYTKYLMITEYLEGGSLFDLLHKRHTQLTEDRIILIAEDIALGMNYLHGRRVLHCDLKSSNILIDSNWNIKLCDFGLSLAKSKLDKKKNAGRIGTPHWMAPEILRGEKYDEYSDIYSYGMILWEMVTRETPFKGFSITQIIGSVGFDSYRVPIPQKGNPLILKIMEKCLYKEREKRPSFKMIVECLQNRNREKEKKNEVISELKNFFGV